MISRVKFNTDVEDSAINDHFISQYRTHKKNIYQKDFLPSTQFEQKNMYDQQYHPQSPFISNSRIKKKQYLEIKKTPLIKSKKKFCGNEKCKICKRLKPVYPRQYQSYASHQKQKPQIPNFPQIRPNKKKQPQIQLLFTNYKNPIQYRKVRSVIQIPNNQEYNKNRIKVVYQQPNEPEQNIQKAYTEPQQKQLPKFVKINGKFYEILEDQTASYQPYHYNKQSQRYPSVYHMVSPILQEKYSYRDLIRYQKQRQRSRQRQLQKQKQKQKLKQKQRQRKEKYKEKNQLINQAEIYIKYDTMFHHIQNGTNSPQRSQKKQKQPAKMTLYRLRQDLKDNQQKNQLFQTIYQRQDTKNNQTQKKQEQDQQKVEVYNILFPSLSQVQQRISTYESLTGQINIDVLKKSKNYIRQYSNQLNKQYLYFGSYDHEKKQRKGLGVLVTKKYILQGVWMNNQILRGAELKPSSLYKGDFKGLKKHGQGTCKWLNGQQYMGQWVDGKRNGNGLWSSKNGQQTYSGQWKNGKVCGYGQYYKKNYSIYKGSFDNFIKNGSGVQQFQNGDRFEGQYINGFVFGFGKYTWQCGLIYQGEFKKGIRQGKGILKKKNLFQLNGFFENDKPHGFCKLKLSNNETINCQYLYGERYQASIKQSYQNLDQDNQFWNQRNNQQKLGIQKQNIFQDQS